jgi:hypothetical protein
MGDERASVGAPTSGPSDDFGDAGGDDDLPF